MLALSWFFKIYLFSTVVLLLTYFIKTKKLKHIEHIFLTH